MSVESQETNAPQSPLSTTAAARLVAGREIHTQVRSKPFVISTLVTVVLIIGGFIALGFMGGDDEDEVPVAAVELPAEHQQMLEETNFEVTQAGSMDEAEQLLQDGDVDVIAAFDEESYIQIQLIGLDELPMTEAQNLSVMPTMDVLDGDAEDSDILYFVAMAFGLIYMLVAMGSGMIIMQNTIQEKQNRIVEILLSAISAKALLAGKILGNSIVALGQFLTMAVASVVGMAVSGQLEYLEMLTWPMAWFLVFFIPGFLLVASVFAATASLVSRQEDSGSVMTPAMMLVMAPYIVALFGLNNDLVMTVASYVPFTSPVAMSVRLFDGSTAWFEPLLSMGILVITTVLVMALAARIYSGALLHTGQRVKLSQALKSEN
ncbi:ABC transporter permease [Nesterenkonia sp. MY13]|uniref:ABC transporter permease n=1 Tax=Nesterenkonia sedimenti TaxID=1463632 RepID=A0A7X8YD35_9MICC|nr:ABC transporter permease [Nesterenkonia sedimenti]NLS09204.1 ABC transporter permease [Nesterenkonia sedimenti]